ncbi:MAG: pseudaminic acid synthase [Phenylobacterium sp.]
MSETLAYIDGRPIGPGHPPYVVAEMSGNPNGDIQRALDLISAAAGAGADAVKIQTYTADTITLDHDGPGFRISGGLWDGRRLHELYAEAHTPWDWHARMFDHARAEGITLFSSPFDATAVDLLERLGAPAYKIASFELVDLPLIRRCAATGKPLVMSTGMAAPEEIAEAVEAARGAGARDLVVLHCTSAYPAPMSSMNLATLPDMARRFGVLPGLSDHTLGTAASVAAVALGAVFIEKHFTLSRAEGGVDSAFSLEPAELAELVQSCRGAWEAMGRVAYGPGEAEAGNAGLRRSLYASAPVRKGEVFTASNVRSVRPGHGLAPKHLDTVIGRRATRDIPFGEPMDWSMVEGGGPA